MLIVSRSLRLSVTRRLLTRCSTMSSSSSSSSSSFSSSSSSSSCPGDDMVWLHEVDSTMDEARKLLKQHTYQEKKCFAVVGDYQTAGRGTRGRNWVSTVGNLYMTLVLNMTDIPIGLSLTPIRMGSFIVQAIDRVVSKEADENPNNNVAAPVVQLKWPNDVIVNGDKVSGVLIEIEEGKMLVGIGCNIATSPPSPEDGPDSGCRDATSLSHFLPSIRDEQVADDIDGRQKKLLNVRDFLAFELLGSVRQWVIGPFVDSTESVIDDFQCRMDSSWQMLRRDHHLDQGFSYGDEVKPLRLNQDGTLQVMHKSTTTERILVAEYLR